MIPFGMQGFFLACAETLLLIEQHFNMTHIVVNSEPNILLKLSYF